MGTPTWSMKQEQALRRLWTETDLTAAEIAERHVAEIGLRTRNAILGKLHRMKLLNQRSPKNAHYGPRVRSVLPPIMDGKWR